MFSSAKCYHSQLFRHVENVKGYLISATRPSKYSTSCSVENTIWDGVHVHFWPRLLVCTIITIAHETTTKTRYVHVTNNYENVWCLPCLLSMRNRSYLVRKRLSLAVLDRLNCSVYSQVLSRYWSIRGIWPAPFPTWAGSPLLRRPGDPKLP